jgi:hypothetical protein
MSGPESSIRRPASSLAYTLTGPLGEALIDGVVIHANLPAHGEHETRHAGEGADQAIHHRSLAAPCAQVHHRDHAFNRGAIRVLGLAIEPGEWSGDMRKPQHARQLVRHADLESHTSSRRAHGENGSCRAQRCVDARSETFDARPHPTVAGFEQTCRTFGCRCEAISSDSPLKRSDRTGLAVRQLARGRRCPEKK